MSTLQENKIMATSSTRNEAEPYPEYNLSNQLLQHQLQMLQFLYYTQYDIIYETFELKHAAYLEKKKGEVERKFKSQQIHRHYEMVSQRVHIRILRDDIDLDKHLSRLQLLWHNRNIPYFHRYYFLKYIFTTFFKNLQKLISNEEKLIKEEQHIYFSIFRAINARQSCLRQLRKALAELTPEDVYEYLHVAKQRLYLQRRRQEQEKYKIQGYKVKMAVDQKHGKLSKTKFQFFSDSFNHLTKLTIYVIQLILKWREYIYSLTHDQRKKKERIEYYYYDDNYFLKILQDIGFLRVSFLSNFYDFAPKNDPFLLRCILAFEKRDEKTLENQLLKQIFMPQPQHLAQIMSKLQFLSQQYKNNIRSRRVYDLNVLKRPMKIAEEKSMRNGSPKQPISNLILKKIESPKKDNTEKMVTLENRSNSLKTFRVRNLSSSRTKEPEEKQKIIIDFKNKNNRRKNVSIPGIREKMIFETESSPLKNSIILEKHPMNKNINMDQMIDAKMLALLKEEVIKKVKAQFQQETKKQLNKNQALQVYIDSKVKEAMTKIFPYEPQKELRLPIQFTTKSMVEEDVSSQIVKIYKRSIFRFQDMQFKQSELLKKIQAAQFVYFIKATIGEEEIGDLVVIMDRQSKEFKALKILYVGFYDLSQLQMLMLRAVQFLWKYQNSFQIHFSFMQPTVITYNSTKNLQINCIVVIKQIYSNVAQVKFIFKRKSKNVNYIPNKYPTGIHLNFACLLGQKKLMLENSSFKKRPQPFCYDYFMMEILRKFISSEDFVLLKEKIKWQDRLKLLLEMIMSIQSDPTDFLKLKLNQAENISELHKKLTKDHEYLLEVSDLVKLNLLKLLTIQVNLTMPFPVKSTHLFTSATANPSESHTQYFRYTIRQEIEYHFYKETSFYIFPCNEIKSASILIFPASQYLKEGGRDNGTGQQKYLSMFIYQALKRSQIQKREVENMWIPMFRYPQKYSERQDIYLPTYRVPDLQPIKKDVLIAEKTEYFCDMQMQNGIKYIKNKHDLVIDKPYGIGILMGPARWVLYARIVQIQ